MSSNNLLYQGTFIDIEAPYRKDFSGILKQKNMASIKLASMLSSKKVFKHIQPFECGWNDGGCRILAQAFSNCFETLGFPSQLKYVLHDFEKDFFVDHVVCEVKIQNKKIYLDSNGFFDRPDLEAYWRLTERSTLPKKAIYVSSKSPGIPDILENEAVSWNISRAIEKSFKDIFLLDLVTKSLKAEALY